jgi:hypothetical protein
VAFAEMKRAKMEKYNFLRKRDYYEQYQPNNAL